MFTDIKLTIILGLAVVLLACCIALSVTRMQIKAQKLTIEALTAQRDQARQESASAVALMLDQGSAITAWKAKAEESKARADASILNAQAIHDEFQDQLAAILASTPPKDAEAALDWASRTAADVQSKRTRP